MPTICNFYESLSKIKTFILVYSRPSDYSDLVAKANVAVNAIKRVYGAQFQVGSSANLICNYE